MFLLHHNNMATQDDLTNQFETPQQTNQIVGSVIQANSPATNYYTTGGGMYLGSLTAQANHDSFMDAHQRLMNGDISGYLNRTIYTPGNTGNLVNPVTGNTYASENPDKYQGSISDVDKNYAISDNFQPSKWLPTSMQQGNNNMAASPNVTMPMNNTVQSTAQLANPILQGVGQPQNQYTNPSNPQMFTMPNPAQPQATAPNPNPVAPAPQAPANMVTLPDGQVVDPSKSLTPANMINPYAGVVNGYNGSLLSNMFSSPQHVVTDTRTPDQIAQDVAMGGSPNVMTDPNNIQAPTTQYPAISNMTQPQKDYANQRLAQAMAQTQAQSQPDNSAGAMTKAASMMPDLSGYMTPQNPNFQQYAPGIVNPMNGLVQQAQGVGGQMNLNGFNDQLNGFMGNNANMAQNLDAQRVSLQNQANQANSDIADAIKTIHSGTSSVEDMMAARALFSSASARRSQIQGALNGILSNQINSNTEQTNKLQGMGLTATQGQAQNAAEFNQGMAKEGLSSANAQNLQNNQEQNAIEGYAANAQLNPQEQAQAMKNRIMPALGSMLQQLTQYPVGSPEYNALRWQMAPYLALAGQNDVNGSLYNPMNSMKVMNSQTLTDTGAVVNHAYVSTVGPNGESQIKEIKSPDSAQTYLSTLAALKKQGDDKATAQYIMEQNNLRKTIQ